jgi:hypothetical protein
MTEPELELVPVETDPQETRLERLKRLVAAFQELNERCDAVLARLRKTRSPRQLV